MKRTGINIAISIPLGFFLMIPLSMLFDAMDWPLFHSWGLAHGSFILAWPLLTMSSFVILAVIGHMRNSPKNKDLSISS